MGNGHTTRSGAGGYRLPTLVDYVSKADGELLIFSGTSASMKIPLFDSSKAIMYDEKTKQLISVDLDEI